jgi:predicted nuclease of predicted toxin-antitoxin system
VRFLIDESSDARLAAYLTTKNHDATLVAQAHRPGLSDREVLAIALREGRVLVTDDRDFGELVFRQRQRHSGVIYFRLRDTLLQTRLTRLAYVLERYSKRLDEFVVVTDHRVRLR